jgi:hypothetical protein
VDKKIIAIGLFALLAMPYVVSAGTIQITEMNTIEYILFLLRGTLTVSPQLVHAGDTVKWSDDATVACSNPLLPSLGSKDMKVVCKLYDALGTEKDSAYYSPIHCDMSSIAEVVFVIPSTSNYGEWWVRCEQYPTNSPLSIVKSWQQSFQVLVSATTTTIPLDCTGRCGGACGPCTTVTTTVVSTVQSTTPSTIPGAQTCEGAGYTDACQTGATCNAVKPNADLNCCQCVPIVSTTPTTAVGSTITSTTASTIAPDCISDVDCTANIPLIVTKTGLCVAGKCEYPVIPECADGKMYNPTTGECDYPLQLYGFIIAVASVAGIGGLVLAKKGGLF